MIWGIKLYSEDDEILCLLNWLHVETKIADWVYQDIPEGK